MQEDLSEDIGPSSVLEMKKSGHGSYSYKPEGKWDNEANQMN